jgi:hypothetical protein
MAGGVQANGRYAALSCPGHGHRVAQFCDHRGRRVALRLGVQRVSHRGNPYLLAARRMRSQKKGVSLQSKERRLLAVSLGILQKGVWEIFSNA